MILTCVSSNWSVVLTVGTRPDFHIAFNYYGRNANDVAPYFAATCRRWLANQLIIRRLYRQTSECRAPLR